MLDYLVRFAQVHESFRLAELQAIADLYKTPLEVIHYSKYAPFAVVRVPSEHGIVQIAARAILIQHVYELWGSGSTYEDLFTSIRENAVDQIPKYLHSSFKFSFDSFQGCRSSASQRQVIDSFSWMDFLGPISLKSPDENFVIFEEYAKSETLEKTKRNAVHNGTLFIEPEAVRLGRLICSSGRDLIHTFSLKKRKYLSNTSMDAEMALIMANMVQARPGTLFLDPFVGTGSLSVTCAHFGATVFGSDIDPRPLRGKDGLGIKDTYRQYHTDGRDLGAIVSDLVNTPFRGWDSPSKPGEGVHSCEWLDGIICDPPYGIREGIKTLGRRNDADKVIHYSFEGLASHLKPYSFTAILTDLLSFAASVLVPDGRLSFWMPTADDVEETLETPMNRKLELVSVCTQPFNKWSRRLITYRKRHEDSCPPSPLLSLAGEVAAKSDVLESERIPSVEPASNVAKTQANDLNPFRKRYFQGFRSISDQAGTTIPADSPIESNGNGNEKDQPTPVSKS